MAIHSIPTPRAAGKPALGDTGAEGIEPASAGREDRLFDTVDDAWLDKVGFIGVLLPNGSNSRPCAAWTSAQQLVRGARSFENLSLSTNRARSRPAFTGRQSAQNAQTAARLSHPPNEALARPTISPTKKFRVRTAACSVTARTKPSRSSCLCPMQTLRYRSCKFLATVPSFCYYFLKHAAQEHRLHNGRWCAASRS